MAKTKSNRDATPLVRRFPALMRIGRRLRLRRLPVMRQASKADAGITCVAMILHYWGKEVPLDELRDPTRRPTQESGNALTLLGIATLHGIRGRGVKIELEDFVNLPNSCILQWRDNHFVVLDRVTEDGGAVIIDPAVGRRRISASDVKNAFSGVALLFEPTDAPPVPKKGDKKAKPVSHLRRYLKQVLTEGGMLGRIIFTSLLMEAFGIGGPLLVKNVTDLVIPRGDGQLLVILLAGMLVLLALQTLTNLVRTHLFMHLRSHLSLRMSLGFIEHVVRLPYAFFQKQAAGDLMSRLDSNNNIRETLTGGALSAILDGFLVFGYFAMLCYHSFSFALMVLVLALLQMGVFALGRWKQKALLAESLIQQSKEQSYEVEMFTGIETLKAMGCEDRALQRWSELFIDVINNGIGQSRLSAVLEAAQSILGMLNSLAPLIYGSYLALSGKLSFGTMLMVNSLGGSFLGSLSKLFSTALSMQILGVYVERINDILDAQPEQAEDNVHPAPPLKGAITLQNVSFRYNELQPMIVRNVTVDIKPGQFVALVGRSGAGKSTLANLLLGLYQPADGAVMFDGMNLAQLDLRTVRRQLGIVTQSHALFASTIRENITMSDPSIPLEDVILAAKIAQIHDDIVGMPLGYNTPLADRGYSLSGGQRQRLAMARALVRRPAILLLDEATSALDAATEKNVQTAISHLKCTRVVIAHRLSTVVNADQIIVFDKGQVAEVGTHPVLLAKGGIYSSLVAAQAGSGGPLGG